MNAKTLSPPAAATEGLLARCGNVSHPGERTFWMLGRRQADFEAAVDLVEAMMARHPRVDMLFTAPQAETRQWLQRRFPRAVVLPPPLPFTLCCSRYLLNLNVRGVAMLGAAAAEDRPVLRAAGRRALPVVILETPQGTAAQTHSAAELGVMPERIDHHFVASQASRQRLLEAGVAAERISVIAPAGEDRVAAFVDTVSDLLLQDLKLIRSKLRPVRRRLERLALNAMERPRWRRLLSMKVERIDTLEELGEVLGRPDTILCLGNGPSSEGPEVAAVRYEALFRVNHVWLKRGFLTKPDMVFTNSKPTLAAVKGAIFGLHTIKSEARLLAASLLSPLAGHARYAAIERFGLYLSEPRWQGIRPTNGAIMLATAVALQPRRLVIAGIDLFSHPAGSYPGDTTTPNAYTPGHDAESELALLLEALRRYKGKLTILSPALRERWEAFQSAAQREKRQDTG